MFKRRKQLSKEFIEENKQACIQEIGIQIQQLNTFISEIANMEVRDTDIAETRNYLMLIGHSVGYLTAVYNEFMSLETGVVKQEENPIGFSALERKK
jgi:hypothetical protein